MNCFELDDGISKIKDKKVTHKTRLKARIYIYDILTQEWTTFQKSGVSRNLKVDSDFPRVDSARH